MRGANCRRWCRCIFRASAKSWRTPHSRRLHRLRLATKRLRYTLELFRPCYGPGLEARLEELRKVQQRLGELNDCVAAWNLLSKGMGRSSARARVGKFLRGRARQQAKDFRDEWRNCSKRPAARMVDRLSGAAGARVSKVTETRGKSATAGIAANQTGRRLKRLAKGYSSPIRLTRATNGGSLRIWTRTPGSPPVEHLEFAQVCRAISATISRSGHGLRAMPSPGRTTGGQRAGSARTRFAVDGAG